jgi:hypothetical protein
MGLRTLISLFWGKRMGITIHYTLISKKYENVIKSINLAKQIAKKLGYKPEYFEDEGEVEFSWNAYPIGQIKGFNPQNTIEWLTEKYGIEPLKTNKRIRIFEIDIPRGVIFYGKDYDWEGNYVDHFYYSTIWFYYKEWIERGNWKVNGYPSVERGIIINTETTETFSLSFFEFKGYYICDHFCKTQPFSEDEYLPNLKHHINFVNILELIEPLMDHSYISDEGEYYETHNPIKLSQNFGLNAEMIWALAGTLAKVSDINVGNKFSLKRKK